MPVTTLLAGYMALLLIVLSARVVGARQASASEELLTRRMRGQANFTEYVPVALILFAILEWQDFNSWVLAILALAFAFGRTIHGYAFAFTDYWAFGRLYGTIITFTVVGALGLIALVMGLIGAFS